MLRVIALAIVFFCNPIHAQNTIISLVNNNVISLTNLEPELSNLKTNSEKIELLNARIDLVLQLQKVTELNLKPSNYDLQNAILKIAQNKNLTNDELSKFKDFTSIKKEILDKLSILNLQRFITKNLKVSEEQILKACSGLNSTKNQKQIKIAQIIISEIDSQISDLDKKNLLIKDFLSKLASHIKKGASFEAFAKLHSQHPSYYNGGITDWLRVEGPTLEMLDSLGNNEVSEIYMTDFGLAIATKVDERYISSELKECEEQLVYNNAKLYYSSWLTTLRNQAKIEIYYDKLL